MRQKLTTRKIASGGLFLALAVLLPQVFHLIGGPSAGKTFLPMHIPVLLAGCFLQVRSPHFCKIFSPGTGGEFLCKPSDFPVSFLCV